MPWRYGVSWVPVCPPFAQLDPLALDTGDRPAGKGIGLAFLGCSKERDEFFNLGKGGSLGQVLLEKLAHHPPLEGKAGGLEGRPMQGAALLDLEPEVAGLGFEVGNIGLE